LALPEDEVTPEAVKAKLDAHKAEWDAKSKPEHSQVTNKDTTLSPQSSEAAAGTTYRPTHASGEWTEYPNAPEGVHKPGEAESDIEMERRGVGAPETKLPNPEDEATSFNPEAFQTRTSDVKVTPLSERPNKTILTVKVDGERAGQMSLTPAPELGKDAMEISTSQLGEAFRGKGHGTEMYRKVIAYAKDKGIKTIYSDDAVSTKADNVWQSLVRKGEAKWDSSVKRYKVTISPLGKIKS
jgi:predicted GNAT family acetyltransferase